LKKSWVGRRLRNLKEESGDRKCKERDESPTYEEEEGRVNLKKLKYAYELRDWEHLKKRGKMRPAMGEKENRRSRCREREPEKRG